MKRTIVAWANRWHSAFVLMRVRHEANWMSSLIERRGVSHNQFCSGLWYTRHAARQTKRYRPPWDSGQIVQQREVVTDESLPPSPPQPHCQPVPRPDRNKVARPQFVVQNTNTLALSPLPSLNTKKRRELTREARRSTICCSSCARSACHSR